MTISCVGMLYVADEIEDLIKSGTIADERVLLYLKDVVNDTIKLYDVHKEAINLIDNPNNVKKFTVTYNQYRSARGSVTQSI